MVEYLPLDPGAKVPFRPPDVGIFLHPVTFGGQRGGSRACVSGQDGMSRNNRVVSSRFKDESI